MHRRRLSVALCGLLVALAGRSGLAQEVGDQVRVRQAVELKVEDQVVATVPAGDPLTVRRTSDKWLWVQTADGQRGWVLKELVRPAGNTTEIPPAPPGRLPTPAAARPADPASGNDPWLLAIGVLAGQNIYTTYAYIGAVADGYEYKTYDAEEVQQLMADVSSMSRVAADHLRHVRDSGIVADDRAAIERVMEILADLSTKADALGKYAQTKDEQDLKAYNEARTKVWPKVRDMLQLE
jgi:hypothetical protein